MLKVILILWGSALVGFLLRRWPQPWVSKLLTWSIWVMLFFIGAEVGGNDTIMQSLGLLGGEALLMTIITALTCCIGSLWFWRRIAGQRQQRKNAENAERVNTKRSWHVLLLRAVQSIVKESGVILLFFFAGCLAGIMGINRYLPAEITFYSLCFLLVCVGFGIGQNRELAQSLKQTKKRFMLLPLVTILCTWIGASITALILTRHSWGEWMAVGSGFGYYSLSSILISEVKGSELGTIALMYNIFREIITIVLAPLFVRYFGPLAPITLGGATTADTTLPTITRVSGDMFVPIAIFHGLIVDLTVPILVPFFCSLGW